MSVYLPANTINELLNKELYIKKLKPQERRFVEVFCIHLSIEKTAQILKWKVTKCYRLLKKPEIQQAIEYMQDIISFRNTITQDYLITELKKIIENQSTKTSDKLTALNLLARLTGHLKDKQEINATTVVLKQEALTVKPQINQNQQYYYEEDIEDNNI